MRWTTSSDASSGLHATAAASRAADLGSGRRRCTGRRMAGTARNRTGVGGDRSSAGSSRAHAALGGLWKRLDDSVENLTPSWSQLFGEGGAEGRLKRVRCGSGRTPERGAAAAAEAVADPSFFQFCCYMYSVRASASRAGGAKSGWRRTVANPGWSDKSQRRRRQLCVADAAFQPWPELSCDRPSAVFRA